jgi:hypothetical protein
LQLGGGCFCSRGETKAPSLSASEILPLFCVGGEASAHELSLPLSLSLSLSSQRRARYNYFILLLFGGGLLLARGNHSQSATEFSPSFAVWGGEASAREGRPSHHMIDFSPSFAVWGGRLLLTRGNKGAFSERDRILPLFCSVGGGNDQNTTININSSKSPHCQEK